MTLVEGCTLKVNNGEPGSARMPAISGIEAAPRNITALAGLRVVAELIGHIGVRELIDAHLTIKERERGFTESDFVLAIAMLLLNGNAALDDLDRLRDDSELLAMLGLRVPASTTGGDFLRKVTPGHIRQFEKLQRALLAAAHERVSDVAAAHDTLAARTVDCDSSLAEAFGHQQGADRVHGGSIAFHPHFAFDGDSREALHGLFRRGRAHASGTTDDLIAFVQRAFNNLPGKADRKRFRGDAAYCNSAFMQWLASEQIEFAVTARMMPNLKQKIADLPGSAWMPEPGGRASDGGTPTRPCAKLHAPEVAGFDHEFGTDDGTSIRLRVVVRRRRSAERQKTIGDFEEKPDTLHAIATNRRDLGIIEILNWADDRANAENMVRELKSDLDACGAGLYQFFANAAVMHVGMLAYNLICWLRLIAAACDEPEAARWQARSWRTRLFALPGYLARSGRKLLMRVAATPPVLALLTTLVSAISSGSG